VRPDLEAFVDSIGLQPADGDPADELGEGFLAKPEVNIRNLHKLPAYHGRPRERISDPKVRFRTPSISYDIQFRMFIQCRRKPEVENRSNPWFQFLARRFQRLARIMVSVK